MFGLSSLNFFNKFSGTKSNKPLKPPTIRELQLIEELRQTLVKLPHEKDSNGSRSESIWKQNIDRLRSSVLSSDPRDFLRWDVIHETMFVSNEKYITTELKHLTARRDWNGLWSRAIKEVPIGHPPPFKKYPNSSGNLIHHAYHISQFEEKTGARINRFDFLFEFGGGYGSMCRLLHNMNFKGKYVIFDLPHFTALQTYYLKSLDLPVGSFEKLKSKKNGVTCISEIKDLESIIHKHVDSKSLFIATWSLSEAPLFVREKILSLLPSFDSLLIAFQDNFGEVNNTQYFEKYIRNNNRNTHWLQWEIEHLPGNYYLIGNKRKKQKAGEIDVNSYKDATCHDTNDRASKADRAKRIVKTRQYKEIVTHWFNNLFYVNSLRKKLCDKRHKKNFEEWRRSGRPIPPPDSVKQMIVREYALKYKIRVFIETGTYLGGMVHGVKDIFDKIYSIELGKELYKRARDKFLKYKHVSILLGNSSKVLPKIIKEIEEPCLFWLDAHYSEGITVKGDKETPIMEELNHIFSHSIKDHVILIDDARCFTGINDYPSIEELKHFVLNKFPKHRFNVKDDIIRIYKNEI